MLIWLINFCLISIVFVPHHILTHFMVLHHISFHHLTLVHFARFHLMAWAVPRWTIEKACAFAADWEEEARVSVNLSPTQLFDQGLVDHVESRQHDQSANPKGAVTPRA